MTRAVDVASRELPPNTALGTRNLIINGDMRIAQRGTSVTGITTSSFNTVDRWTPRLSAVGTWTETQDTDVPSDQGFANSLKFQCTTANASLGTSNLFILQHRLEGQNLQHLKKGTANAESLTLSFWVKSNKTGTYVVDLYDTNNTRTISKSYTIDIADTWEKKTLTYEGDTTGALNNDNARSIDINMWLAAGSNYSSGTLNTSWTATVQANRAVGNVNLADSTSNYINITGVQLEVGEEATEFEHRPYDMELARCMRYYEKSYSDNVAPASNTYDGMVVSSGNAGTATTGEILHSLEYKVDKRAIPTLSIYDAAGNIGKCTRLNSGVGNYDNSAVATTLITHKNSFIYSNTGTNAGMIRYHYVADSEL